MVRQRLVSWTENEHRNANEVQHDGWNIHHVVRPIAPAGEEAVKISEDFLGPQVNAAFTGIALRELDHGYTLRPEK